MTRTDIEAKFKDMMLDFNPVGNREKSRKYGYWAVPAEFYKFKIVPSKERNIWEIKIESHIIPYTAEEGIEFIQDLIRDKMEEQVDRINNLSWIQRAERRNIRLHVRATKQLWRNPSYTNYNSKNGKKNTIF